MAEVTRTKTDTRLGKCSKRDNAEYEAGSTEAAEPDTCIASGSSHMLA